MLSTKHAVLLVTDAAINIILGVLLLLFPAGLIELLGLPPTPSFFYTSIFGAVLFGIGIALIVEVIGASRHMRGLGLGGAIIINLCGGAALLIWLLKGSLTIPLRGSIVLWSIALIVLAISLAEILTKSWSNRS